MRSLLIAAAMCAALISSGCSFTISGPCTTLSHQSRLNGDCGGGCDSCTPSAMVSNICDQPECGTVNFGDGPPCGMECISGRLGGKKLFAPAPSMGCDSCESCDSCSDSACSGDCGSGLKGRLGMGLMNQGSTCSTGDCGNDSLGNRRGGGILARFGSSRGTVVANGGCETGDCGGTCDDGSCDSCSDSACSKDCDSGLKGRLGTGLMNQGSMCSTGDCGNDLLGNRRGGGILARFGSSRGTVVANGGCETGDCGGTCDDGSCGSGTGGLLGRASGGMGCGALGCGHGGRLCNSCLAKIGFPGPSRGPIPHTAAPMMGPGGPTAPSYVYPYYTTRGPRDFLLANPPSIGY